jgi:hypothetical protein
MPQTNLNTLYLPLTRDLTYQTNRYINGQLLETQAGDIFPEIATSSPISTVFYAENVDVTASEWRALQNFYQKYYMQKFCFKDPNESQKTLSVIETPNGIITQFTVNNNTPNALYFVQSAKIYSNTQLISTATLNTDLKVTFLFAPTTGSLISVTLDYDYAVMFDYQYGLSAISDPKTKTYKINFRLVSC